MCPGGTALLRGRNCAHRSSVSLSSCLGSSSCLDSETGDKTYGRSENLLKPSLDMGEKARPGRQEAQP